MKKLKFILTIVFTMIAFTAFCGGKAKLISGNLSSLKGKTVGIQYVYDGMAVGKYKAESDYIARKKADYNKDEPGRGDKWEAAWKADRASRFEPKFLLLLTENCTATGIQFGTSGEYKMIVKTTFTEPGFNIGIARASAVINTEYTFQDGSGKELAKVAITGATGSTFGGYDFDTGVRITEAYALSGKILGKFLSKMVK